MTSYIYFIQAENEGSIKIGTTGDDPRKRMVKIQSDCPWPVKLLGAIEGSASQEKQIHLVLSPWRVKGEWFAPHPIVLAAVNEALRCGKTISFKVNAPKYAHPLCEFRAGRNLSLDDLSNLTGLSPASLSRFESGARKPNPKVLSRLCKATGVPAAKLRPDICAILYGRAQ